MSKQSRDRRSHKRLTQRIRNGRATQEDVLVDTLVDWSRAIIRRGHRHWEGSKKSLLMDDFEYADYCVRDWVPQLIHKGRKP